MGRPDQPDELNLAGYSKASVARRYGGQSGYWEPGERVVFDIVALEMRNRTILDIGVGAGRTVPLLRAISEDYTAIDYSPEMVAMCRRLHPGVRVDVGDARDLGAFGSESIDLVVFSCAGIDHVNHAERQQILGEIRRVLRPGGIFVFSTHNLRGAGYGEKPWGSRRELTLMRHMAGLALWFPVNLRNYRRYRSLGITGDGWSLRISASEHFQMVMHYTTLNRQLGDLVAAGFASAVSYQYGSGRPLEPGEDTDGWWLHIIARR